MTYAYMRVSGPSQGAGDGFPRQQAAILAALPAGTDPGAVVWFRDDGVSGKTELADRPALLELVSGLKPGDYCIVERLDRLARDVLVQEAILRDIARRGATFRSATEPDLCGTDPSRKFIRQVLGALAEYEREMIVAKLRAARDRVKARRGWCEGAPLRASPEAIALAREMRAAGATLREVAAALTDAGIPTGTGRAVWAFGSVRTMLKAAAKRMTIGD